MNIKNLSVATQLFWKKTFSKTFEVFHFCFKAAIFLHRLFSKDRSRYQVEFPDRSSHKNSAMQRLANQYLFAKRKPRPGGLENETRGKCRKWNQKHGGKEHQKQVEQIMWCIRIPIGFWNLLSQIKSTSLILYTYTKKHPASVGNYRITKFVPSEFLPGLIPPEKKQ